MGRSIDRHDGEDFTRCASCHLQIGGWGGGRPIRLQTDKGTAFNNRVFQKFLKEHDMPSLPLTTRSIKPVSLKVLTEH